MLIFITFSLKGQENTSPILVINPEGHRGQIRDLEVTTDRTKILTCSFDKTIKEWDAETGLLLREFRGQIGPGSEGMVYDIALSHDQKYLAAGGWFGKNDETEKLGDIRIYNYESGELIQLLRGITNVVFKLEFTADGQLISGDADGDIHLWDIEKGRIVRTYSKKHRDGVSALAVKDECFVSGGFNGFTYKWNLDETNPIAKDTTMNYIGLQVDDVNISSQDEIAICGGQYIIHYDHELVPQQLIENKYEPVDIDFSPDGNRLVCGALTTGKYRENKVYAKNKAQYWEYLGAYKQHKNAVLNAAFIDNETCLTAGGDFDEIVRWKIDPSTGRPEEEFNVSGVGMPLYAASLADKKLGYATKWSSNEGLSDLNAQFDFYNRKTEPLNPSIQFKKPVIERGSWSMRTESNGNESSQAAGRLLVQYLEDIKTKMDRDYWSGSRHNVYTFTPNNYIISGGSYGIMSAYTRDGVEVSRFVGHEGDIWGASISKDGTRLVSCGSDQTIKIWSLAHVGKPRQDIQLPSVWEYCEEMDVEAFHRIFKMHGLDEAAKGKSPDQWRKVITGMEEYGYSVQFLKMKLNESLMNYIHPIASIFIARNGEWIVWNNDGYFMSSKKGAQYVGYHINQGKEKAAKYYPFEQFDLKYNRPDIIMEDLAMVNQEIIDLYYMAYQKRLKKMNLSEDQISGELHLPTTLINRYELTEDQRHAELEIKVSDTKYDLNRMNVYLNDVPVFGRDGIDLSNLNNRSYTKNLKLKLAGGRNKIQVSVMNNKGAESLRETIYMQSIVPKRKSRLFIASIGTSDYANDEFDLKYAAKDAKDVVAYFENHSVFDTTRSMILTDSAVTRANLNKVKRFLQMANRNDVVLLFIAGHGVLDDEYNYYFGTHDINFNNPEEKGVAYSEIEELIDGLQAIKKLLFMDTCHSGEIEQEEVEEDLALEVEEGTVLFRNVGSGIRTKEGMGIEQTNEVMKELFTDLRRGTGATVISSAGGTEFAMESDEWKNGLFTYTLLKGLQSKEADENGDGKIYLSEIRSYVRQEVARLSNNKQKPTARLENLTVDFRIQ